jgi:AbiV family abortive infection protein
LKKTEHYTLTKSQIQSGMKKSLFGSHEIAGYAKDLLERNANPVLAFGLYAFAIEEYGKSELIRDCMEKEMKRYQVPKIIFEGKESHSKKIQKALDVLPSECISFDIDDSKKSISLKDNPKKFLTDIQSKTSCFSLNWNEDKETWDLPPKIIADDMLNSILEFEKHVSSKLDLEYAN